MTPTDARPPAEGGPPAPEAPAPDAPAEPPFPSGAAVREAHAALAGLDPPPAAGAVRRFIARVRATGAGLAARAERVEAQTVINYWANTLVALPVSEARKLSAAETTLDRFDAAAAPDLSDKECPFKGLAAFAESDAGRFFGRDEAIAELVERVAQFPLVLVTGPSGAGKSSLVLAGVLPALAERAVDPKPLVLPVVVPGADPLGALAGAVRSQPRPPGAGALDSSRLAWSAADFRTALAARAGTRPVVLVLDQFEEVFTLCESREARGAFAAAVAAVAGAPGNRVIVIVREDYLGQALQLDALKPLTADPGARFAPPPMSSRELRRAVERPAELVGLKFDDGIVDELVKEVVGEATALPLLQFALAKVWENKNRNRITWDVYRAVGSPREALKRTADAVYAQLPQDIDRDVTRLVFLDLVRPTAGVEVVRRRVRREVLRRHAAANTVDGVLRRWEAAGLLRETKGTEPADDRFEVAHEALTRNWPLLAGWLEEKRRTAERELQLASAAKLWADSGRKDGFLLQGAALEEAAAFATAAPEVAELVRESRAEQERETQRKVVVRRVAIGILSILCAFLAVACVVAWSGWAKAERKSREAETSASQARKAAVAADAAAVETNVKNAELQAALKDVDEKIASVNKAANAVGDSQRSAEQFKADLSALATDFAVRNSAVVKKNAALAKTLDSFVGADDAINQTVPYAPEFIGRDLPVGLPKLSPRATADALAGGKPLDYTHYSLVLNRARRLPFFVAANCDRTSLVVVPREMDRFRFDPRVEAGSQSGDELYIENDLDRGMLARRGELTWGPVDHRKAAEGAFYFTNVCPIHKSLNQGVYSSVNGWVLKEFAPSTKKISVFRGPVFRGDDYAYRGAQIPRQYWIVAVGRAGDRLTVQAFLLDHYRPGLTKGGPDFAVYPMPTADDFDPARYRVPLKEVERVTQLDFGTLREFDVPPPSKK